MELNRPKEIYNGVKGIPSYNMLWSYIDDLEVFADDCELYIHDLETKWQSLITENEKLRKTIECKNKTEKANFKEILDLIKSKGKLINALLHLQDKTDYCNFTFEEWNEWSMGNETEEIFNKR